MADQGQNTLLGLTPEHTLIEARVYTNDRTEAALMQDALVTMVRAAAETF